KGAYLNLGGTPERYPTAEEMVAGDTAEQTSFLVVARSDGIYFYNPKSKVVIPPKKGGGTVAVHAQFPDIFDEGHSIKHDTRVGKSGVYTAKCSDVGLDSKFLSYNTVKILVVTTADMEYQTALHPDGVASRIFTPGNNVTPWSFHSGGEGGGGSIDPVVIQEINRRLEELENKPEPVSEFSKLRGVDVDTVNNQNALLYMDETGKVRANTSSPLLGTGFTHVHVNSVGAPPIIASGNISSVGVASNNVIITAAEATRTITLSSVVPYDTFKPTTTQVREGRTTFLVNMSNVKQNVRVAPAHMFYKNGNMDSAIVELPPKTVYIYSPAIIDNGSGAMLPCWMFLGSYQLEDTDLDSVLGGIRDGFTELNDMIDRQQGEIDFIRSEQVSGKLVVEG
ncbi:MAG: hypothetical protein ACRC68_09315, partial [Clostridium sp.]